MAQEAPPEGEFFAFLKVECSHHAMLKNIVENSDAMSGAPRAVIQRELDQVRFSRVRFGSEPMHNCAAVVWLTERPPNAAAKLLIDVLCRSQ